MEEREVNGELSQMIEGMLSIGRDVFNPQFEYDLNGTLTKDGDGYLLQVLGVKK